MTLDCFRYGRADFSLIGIDTLYMDFPPLHIILLPKLLSVDLQNALSTIMVFGTALLWIKEIISQQKKCGNGPMLMNITGLTMFPIILKQLT